MATIRKKRKSRYKTGYYDSSKMGKKIRYRSGYELRVYEYLDKNDDVTAYFAEPFKLPYNYSKRTIKNYIPDLLIVYKNSSTKLVEIKPQYKTTTKTNLAKFKSAEQYCKNNNLVFEVWTEFTLKELIKD